LVGFRPIVVRCPESSHLCPFLSVLLDHLVNIHAVDMISAEDGNDSGRVLFN